jgi:hypothetical protein
MGVKMAKRKEASRRRMEQRRLRNMPEIVAEKVELGKVWHEKHDTSRPEEQDYEVDDPDQAEFQEEIEGDVVMEVSRGNMKGEYRLKTMKAVRGKKKRKYRPLTEEELKDMISKEQGADDQVRPFKERSWVKPKSMNEKTLGLKIKEAIVKRAKEKKAWEESGKPWEEWVKSRQEERLKRRRQKEGGKKDDEWPKLDSKSGSVASTSSRAPWGKESKQDWSVASSSSRAPWERESKQEGDMASTSSRDPWK